MSKKGIIMAIEILVGCVVLFLLEQFIPLIFPGVSKKILSICTAFLAGFYGSGIAILNRIKNEKKKPDEKE